MCQAQGERDLFSNMPNYGKALSELVSEPSGEFKKFTRTSFEDFKNLLTKVSPLIAKQNSRLPKAIPPQVRLAITLRFLSSGDSFEGLHYFFETSPQPISEIVPEACHAPNEVLKEEIKQLSFDITRKQKL
nr:unnamed protein product [Callosobruchus analis]